MQIIKAGYEILDELNGSEILKKIERVARVCEKESDKEKKGTLGCGVLCCLILSGILLYHIVTM